MNIIIERNKRNRYWSKKGMKDVTMGFWRNFVIEGELVWYDDVFI